MEVQLIMMNKIRLGKNSRLDVSDEEISGLMGSIEATGLLQPIGVVKSKDGFDIAYGNRRFMAYSKLGKTTIPAIIYNDKHQADIDTKNLVENVQRRNITPTEMVENVRGLTTQVVLQLRMETKEYDALYKKYITNGPFNTFPELLRSKLNGKTDFRLHIK